VVAIVRPESIIRWHRAGFRAYWRWRSRNRVGRPKVSAELRTLIGEMSRANALWGAPRIHGELLKLGFEVAQSTVARYMADVSQQSRRRRRGDRPLCSADDRIPNSVLSCHCAPRTMTLGVVWRDGKPNRLVDLAPSHRGVPVGPRAAISHSGSRHLVWSSFLVADPCNGHSGPSDRTPIALHVDAVHDFAANTALVDDEGQLSVLSADRSGELIHGVGPSSRCSFIG